MHNHIPFNHLPWLEMHSRKISQHTSLSWTPIYKKTPKKTTQNSTKFEIKGVLKENPCIHERKLPKGSIKPWLEEGSHCLPFEALTMENNLKEKMNSAEILWKWYQKKAWEVGKGLAHSKFHLDQGRSNMQEERSSEEGWFFLSRLSAGVERVKKKKKELMWVFGS